MDATQDLFNTIYRTGVTTLTPLGSRKCEEYRTISWMSHALKLDSDKKFEDHTGNLA